MANVIANASWKTFAAIGGSIVAVIVVSRLCCYNVDFHAGSISLGIKPNK